MKVKNIKRETHIIDATSQSLGRLATKVATLLSGKNRTDFVPYHDKGNFVTIKNIDKIKITGKKLEQKKYYHFTGYPGGLKTKKMGEVFEKNPQLVFRKAVYRMLPKNKLQKPRIKRLKFE